MSSTIGHVVIEYRCRSFLGGRLTGEFIVRSRETRVLGENMNRSRAPAPAQVTVLCTPAKAAQAPVARMSSMAATQSASSASVV